MTLTGKRIVITRAAHQYADFANLLIAEGAQPLSYPAIRIVPAENADRLMSAAFDWIIFTSANAVQAAVEHITLTTGTQIAVVGSAVAEAVQRCFGVQVDVIPPNAGAVHLLEALPVRPGERVLLPQSEIAQPELSQGLRARGAQVTIVIVYRVLTGHGGVNLPALIAQQSIDAITFTSGSTVDHFLWRYQADGGALTDLAGVPLACLGHTVQKALHNAGLTAAIYPDQQSLTALTAAMKDYFHA